MEMEANVGRHQHNPPEEEEDVCVFLRTHGICSIVDHSIALFIASVCLHLSEINIYGYKLIETHSISRQLALKDHDDEDSVIR